MIISEVSFPDGNSDATNVGQDCKTFIILSR